MAVEVLQDGAVCLVDVAAIWHDDRAGRGLDAADCQRVISNCGRMSQSCKV